MAHAHVITPESPALVLGRLIKKAANANEQLAYWRMKRANAPNHNVAVQAGARVLLWEAELAAINKILPEVSKR